MADSPINLKSLSFDSILKDLKEYVKSLPDYDKWKDFYVSSAGTTLLELLAGAGTYLSFHSMAARRESYLESAKLASSVYNISGMLGYEVNRRTAPVFRIKLTDGSKNGDVKEFDAGAGKGFSWGSRFTPVGTYKGHDVVLLSEYAFNNPMELKGKAFDLCLGSWQRQEFVIEDTKPFLKLYVEDMSIDNDLTHLQVWIRQSDNIGKMVLSPVRYAEELAPPGASTKVLVRTTYDGVVLVFGDGTFGFKPIKGQVCVFDYLSTLGRPDIPVSSESLLKGISWASGASLLKNNIQSIEVLSPGYDSDSIDKIKTLATGYFAARRRMLTADDHIAVLMGYPDVVSVGVRRKATRSDVGNCCVVELSPLFSDEHFINSGDRELVISDEMQLFIPSGMTEEDRTILYKLNDEFDIASFKDKEFIQIRAYPDNSGVSKLPSGINEYPHYYKMRKVMIRVYEGGKVYKKASFYLTDEDDNPIKYDYRDEETNDLIEPSFKGTLVITKKNYLESDRIQGGTLRTTVIQEWDMDMNVIRTISDAALLDGMRVRFTVEGILKEDGEEVCLPDPFMTTLLEFPLTEYIIERVGGSATDFRLRDTATSNLIDFSEYVIDGVARPPKGTVRLSWESESSSVLVTGWDVLTGEIILDGLTNIKPGMEVQFTGYDPNMDDYLNNDPSEHEKFHDPVSVGNPWNKPWARAVIGDTFIPLSLPALCYEHWGLSDAPTFKIEETESPLRFKLRDKHGNAVYFTDDGVDSGNGGCWMVWKKTGMTDFLGTGEQRNILSYLDEYKVVGELVELVDPVKTIIQLKMTLVTEDTVTVSELETDIKRILRSKIYKMGVTFRPGEVVREVSQLDGVKRVYLEWPTKDRELAYNEYIGFDEGTYADMIVRQSVYGDKQHYIAPLDLSITSDLNMYIGMEPDSQKGYYSLKGDE